MRIVIDMQGAQNGSRHRGIGRYTLAFTQAIVRNRGCHEVIIVLSDLFPESIMDIRAIFEPEIGAEAVLVWAGLSPSFFLDPANDWRRETSQKLREAFLESLGPDIVVMSSMFEGCGDDSITSIGEFSCNIKTAVIFYDLIPLIYEKEYLSHPRVKEWYSEKIDQLKKADLWLAISQSTCEEGAGYLDFDRERLLNISAAVGPEFNSVRSYNEVEVAEFKNRFGITRPFLMYCGATDPRKNLHALIDAWSLLPETIRTSHHLALVGGMPVDHRVAFEVHARSKGVSKAELIFSGKISDEDLILFYRQCKAFVLPSLHEGFGLPALEAMACGAPTIGSNCSSVPEVIGMQEALFDPYSPTDIANRIRSVLSDEDFRSRLLENGRRRSKIFSWDHSACIAWERFERLMADDKKFAKPFLRSGEVLAQELIKAISVEPLASITDSDLLACAYSIDRITPRDDPQPRLYVDISELHRRDLRSGIQRVVRSIAKYLLMMQNQTHTICLVYATEEGPYRHARKFSRRLIGGCEATAGIEDEVIDPRSGDVFLGLDYQDQITISKAPYFEYIRSQGIRVFIVVYDLLPVKLRQYFSKEVCANFENWLHVVSNQDGAICISRDTANEFKKWREINLGTVKPMLIKWFHLGADLENSEPSKGLPDNANQILGFLRSNRTFLSVSTIEPRKGQAQTLAAFELLWQAGLDVNLVLVGKQGWMVESLIEKLHNHIELGKRLFWLEGISDEYLEKVYAASTCLIAASEGEGFGLPLIEAAQHKIPIIARDIPVFHEVAGVHAYYFSGTEAEDLTSTIKEWLRLHRDGHHPTSHNMPWLSWKESAEQLKDIIFNDRCGTQIL